MVCPVCVVGGIGFILSRIFGFPDVIVAFVTGMMATSMAYWVNHIMVKKWKKKKRSACSTKFSIRNCVFVFFKMDWIVVKRSLFNFFSFLSNLKRKIEFHPNSLNLFPHFRRRWSTYI